MSLAISSFGLTSLPCCSPNRESPDPADCAASFLEMTHSHFCSSSRCTHGAKFRARSVCRLRAPESAKAFPKLKCCTAEEAGHRVSKENSLSRVKI